jgi:beta-galactosidase
MKTLTYILLFNLVFLFSLQAQERATLTINSNWLFFKGDTTKKSAERKWNSVSVPHTWNAQDVLDDEPGYYRGVGWYKKTIYVPASWQEKEVYVFFEGVGQVAEVFVNGKSVGKHQGGYNYFSFPIGNYLQYAQEGNGPNEVIVKVDNSPNENIPPLEGDFNFFGGLYRDVYLNVINKVHFDADNYATNGIFITTPVVSDNNATVNIKGAFVNKGSSKRKLVISQKIYDASGKLFIEEKKMFTANPDETVDFVQDFKNIKGQHLWSIEDPYLYNVVSTITEAATNQKLDEVSNPLGFRWYEFDPNKGFFLNGKSVKLIGVSRHQDYKDLGNALPDAIHVHDMELLKQMGGNFIRIAHYPQDPAVFQACDRLGILASVETPIVSAYSETEEFSKNTKEQHLEMIRQKFNHPSIIIWTYMNEELLLVSRGDSTKRESFIKGVTKLAQALEDLTRREDAYRYTMIPNHNAWDIYNKAGLTKIPKLVGWNLYFGWYYDQFEDFGKFLDRHHKELPDKPVLVTEFGADADNRLHSFNPVRFDNTVDSLEYHKASLKTIMERPFVAGASIWNLADFTAERRAESTPHVNSKGILTQDRKEKDLYRFYKANLSTTPYIQIGSKEWNNRTGFAASETALVCNQPVSVFSNQKSVSLKVNGKAIGSAETVQGIAKFDVPFVNGVNRILATATGNGLEITDQGDINFTLLAQNLKSGQLPFKAMNISLGDSRFIYDEKTSEVWIPEQAYKPGSWGYVGGKVFVMKNNSRVSFGGGRNIMGTDLDPMYQTQRTGIEQFKFDVPDGNYEITLHFAELLTPVRSGDLIFNIGGRGQRDEFVERSFNVSVNGNEVLSGLSNNEYLQPEQAVATKIVVRAGNDKGITIDFKALKGESILNGIQIRRVR